MHSIVDRQQAIDFAVGKLANKGDVVGIFGKGHEQSMNLNGKIELPWSDREAALKAIKKRGTP
jgi:UDP-N-acetylmuramoyl-L-alanyl-D-glutamate--2,6-diaminopimelate ligase